MTASAAPNGRPPKPVYAPFSDLPDFPAIVELQQHRQWVSWGPFWKEDKGKWDKPPVNPRTGDLGSVTNPHTWASYEEAAERARRDKLAGVGFVLSRSGNISGIDLDRCRNPETGELQHWAQVAVDFGETYAEVSPSGTGLRFFVVGLIDGRKVDAAQVELYTDGRFLTVTGEHIDGTPTEIREAPRTIAYLQERADQIREAQRVAAERAREAERKRQQAETEHATKAGGAQQTTSQRARRTASPGAGATYWRTVNTRALANLSAWVPTLLPDARPAATGGYRVTSRNLARDLEEDLSISPLGIVDFGTHDMGDPNDGKRTPIDLVMEYGAASTPADAALWLCRQMGDDPDALGWRSGEQGDQRGREEPSTAGGSGQQGDGKSSEQGAAGQGERPRIKATPFVYRDPRSIPPREWIYGRHLIRRFLSTTVAPGAVGKSSLVLVEAIAMVTGLPLLGITPPRPMRVWYVNLEDPLEETERRIAAICLHYGIDPRELEGKLFIDSGRSAEIIIATRTKEGVKVAEPVVTDLTASIRENEVDHMVVDPFVSSHRVTENANDEIDIVAKAWNRVAEVGNASIELVHHVRKGQAGQGEFTVEDGRGAGALLAAARSARVLNPMSRDQAEKAGVPSHRGYFRVDNGKANLAPPPDRSEWFKLTSVDLGNGAGDPDNPLDFAAAGDAIAVVTPWEWPDAFEGIDTNSLRAAQAEVAGCSAAGAKFRLNVQSPDWVGNPIARALQLDPKDKAHRNKISRMLGTWIENGMFTIVPGKDAKGNTRDFVEVGTYASSDAE